MKSVQMPSFLLSIFSCIQFEYRKILTRENSVTGHFSHSDNLFENADNLKLVRSFPNFFSDLTRKIIFIKKNSSIVFKRLLLVVTTSKSFYYYFLFTNEKHTFLNNVEKVTFQCLIEVTHSKIDLFFVEVNHLMILMVPNRAKRLIYSVVYTK